MVKGCLSRCALLMARGENRVAVDSSGPDCCGVAIPIVRFHFSDKDWALWRDMKERGGSPARGSVKAHHQQRLRAFGFASHEAGTALMGNHPRTSVVNSYCQAREPDIDDHGAGRPLHQQQN